MWRQLNEEVLLDVIFIFTWIRPNECARQYGEYDGTDPVETSMEAHLLHFRVRKSWYPATDNWM